MFYGDRSQFRRGKRPMGSPVSPVAAATGTPSYNPASASSGAIPSASAPPSYSLSSYAAGGSVQRPMPRPQPQVPQFGNVEHAEGAGGYERGIPDGTGQFGDIPLDPNTGRDPADAQLQQMQRDRTGGQQGAQVGPAPGGVQSAMNVVNEVLAYGRQKYGLTPKEDAQKPKQEGAVPAPPSMDDATDEPMNKPAPLPNEPKPGYDGDVPDDEQPE